MKSTIKVARGFYNKTSSKKEIASQKRAAKQKGQEIIKIDVADAYHLYITDPFFKEKIKKSGRPQPGQLIIIIHYIQSNQETKPKPTNMILKIKKLAPSPTTIQVPLKKTTISILSPLALQSKTIIIEFAQKNNTHILRKVSKCISLHPYYHNLLAS